MWKRFPRLGAGRKRFLQSQSTTKSAKRLTSARRPPNCATVRLTGEASVDVTVPFAGRHLRNASMWMASLGGNGSTRNKRTHARATCVPRRRQPAGVDIQATGAARAEWPSRHSVSPAQYLPPEKYSSALSLSTRIWKLLFTAHPQASCPRPVCVGPRTTLVPATRTPTNTVTE